MIVVDHNVVVHCVERCSDALKYVIETRFDRSLANVSESFRERQSSRLRF